jgi:hypothetical protein
MIKSRTTLLKVISSIFLAVMIFTPILSVTAERYTLINENFIIEPSQPEVFSETSFSLDEFNDYTFGIPMEDSIGGKSETEDGSHYFEMNTDGRVEVFFLLSMAYLSYEASFDGSAPTSDIYSFHATCDGYLQYEFDGGDNFYVIIIWSDELDISGEFFWSESLDATIYHPYVITAKGSDRETQDVVEILNVNASITLYILDENQWENYYEENIDGEPEPIYSPPSSSESLVSISGTSLELNFTAPPEENLRIIIWHEELHDRVHGSLIYWYNYQRTFWENYWSLLVVIALLIILTLFIVFQKTVLPPIVWTANKLKYYLITVPWEAIKKAFSAMMDAIKRGWAKLLGKRKDIDVFERKEDEE